MQNLLNLMKTKVFEKRSPRLLEHFKLP